MAQLLIDLSGKSGLATRHWGDPDRDTGAQQPNLRYHEASREMLSTYYNSYVSSSSFMVDGYYNPFRRYGYLSAANAGFTTVDQDGTVFTTLPNAVVYDDQNDDVIVSQTSRYFKGLLDGLDDLQFYSGSSMGDLGATGTPTIYDLEIYTINNGRRLFVVYEKSGNLEVGHYPLPYDAGSGTDGFFSGAGGGTIGISNTAFMRVADNGFAYLFSDSYIHKIDGTTTGGSGGTVTPNVLIFPSTFTISDACDYRGKMFIGLAQTPQAPLTTNNKVSTFSIPCGVYVWDRQSTTVGTVDYIPFYGVRSVTRIYVTWSGKLRAIVVNAEGVTEIREYDGNNFNIVCEVGHNAYPTWHDSVTQANGMTIWLASSGDIWCHGSIAPGEPDGLYKIGKLSESNLGTGFIFFGGSNSFSGDTGYKRYRSGLYVGYLNSGGSPIVKQWDMYGTGFASSSASVNVALAGNVYAPVVYLPPMSVVKDITIYMAPGSGSGTTSAGSFKIYFNQSATMWAEKTVTRDEHARGYKHIQVNKPYVNAVQIQTLFPAATQLAGNFDIAPSFAIINYDPSTDKP